MDRVWLVSCDGHVLGIYSSYDKARSCIDSKKCHVCLVRYGGIEEWVQAYEVDELRDEYGDVVVLERETLVPRLMMGNLYTVRMPDGSPVDPLYDDIYRIDGYELDKKI